LRRYTLGGIIGDGKRVEDSDKMLNEIKYTPEFGGWTGPFTYAFYETRLAGGSLRTRTRPTLIPLLLLCASV
jgi:hypothetical protein